MITLAAASDLHGTLPDIPGCDILLLAGDLCPHGSILAQRDWLDQDFRSWLDAVPAKHVVGVAGNHDFIFEKAPDLVPAGLRWHYLQDSFVALEGLKIWGMPWILPIMGVFNLPATELVEKYSRIPNDTDIVVSHGAPYGIGDMVPSRWSIPDTEWPGGEHVGSRELTGRMFEVKPQLVVFGHIHEGHGSYPLDETLFVNATILDGGYKHVHRPWYGCIEPRLAQATD